MQSALLLLACASLTFAATIEERRGSHWPTRNHYRVEHRAAGAGPVAAEFAPAADFNPDSVRVIADTSTEPLLAKVDWRNSLARVSWSAPKPGLHYIYFDLDKYGEIKRLTEPAMIGTGDRITYGRPGVRGRVAVGLWPHPAALDIDDDGDTDLIIGCADRPYNGTYLFRNIGSNTDPLYDRAVWIGPGTKELVAADFNGDGAIDLVNTGGYYSDVKRNRMTRFVAVTLPRNYHVGRDDMWNPVDWDGDGLIDVLAGVSDWRDYGWDDAFNAKGEWMRGPLHGYVYFHRNTGTNADPRYAEPVRLDVDLYGSPAPNPVDWLGRGVLDLIAGSFIDRITLFRNRSGRTQPRFSSGEHVQAGGKPIRMDLCMIQPRVVEWHKDKRPSLLVAEEDGAITLFENRAARGKEPELAPGRQLEQIDPFLKSGALSRPVAVDWNGDGKLDIISGNSAGYLQLFENVGGPSFVDRGYLKADGKTIRHMAGPNLSIQGPAEEKWGYTNPSAGDWDLDGDPDLLVNDITGAVVWYENIGTRTAPQLAAARNIEVEWTGPAPKPEWVWWEPKGKQLVTQWRTTPKIIDWNNDGLPDLVMLNHQGYLCLYRRQRANSGLQLLPPEKLFIDGSGRFLNLSAGRAGRSGRRKIEFADMDSDGDLDLVTDSDDGPVWYENSGTQAKPVMKLLGTVVRAKLAGHNPTPNIADWNGDGKLDLIVGAEDGFFYYFDGRYIESLRREELQADRRPHFDRLAGRR